MSGLYNMFPTIFVWTISWRFINFVIKIYSTFSRKWRNFSIHSFKPFIFKNNNKLQYSTEILGVKS